LANNISSFFRQIIQKEEPIVDILIILVLLVVFLIALVLFSLFRKPPQLTGINDLSEALTNVRIELKGLSEKTQGIEQNQTQVSQGISSLTAELVRETIKKCGRQAESRAVLRSEWADYGAPSMRVLFYASHVILRSPT